MLANMLIRLPVQPEMRACIPSPPNYHTDSSIDVEMYTNASCSLLASPSLHSLHTLTTTA